MTAARQAMLAVVLALITAASLALILQPAPAWAQSPASGDAARGAKAFEECHACHTADGMTNDVGPGLRGIFGRKAGERDDFRYSPALKRSGITWTAETLEAFIADPQKLVPANRMPYAGQPDAAARADLIEYLRQAFR